MSEETFTMQDFVPWEWAGVVCNCENPEYRKVYPSPTDNTVCIKCEKIARWQLLTCTRCNDRYLFAFKHHARTVGLSMGKNHMIRDRSLDGWALDKGLCWRCICNEDPPVEGDVPPAYLDAPRIVRSFEEIVAESEAEEDNGAFTL